MYRILCYGDSNTWGCIGGTGKRFPSGVRWPSTMQMLLGRDYTVIEEGLNGRTTARDDDYKRGRNGETALLPCLQRHAPLDLAIMMLGTNDLKAKFSLSAAEIAEGMEKLIGIILHSNCGRDGLAPNIILICPPYTDEVGELSDLFDGAAQKSRELHLYYEAIANKYDIAYLNGALHARPCQADGVHMDAESHIALAMAVKEMIYQIFK